MDIYAHKYITALRKQAYSIPQQFPENRFDPIPGLKNVPVDQQRAMHFSKYFGAKYDPNNPGHSSYYETRIFNPDGTFRNVGRMPTQTNVPTYKPTIFHNYMTHNDPEIDVSTAEQAYKYVLSKMTPQGLKENDIDLMTLRYAQYYQDAILPRKNPGQFGLNFAGMKIPTYSQWSGARKYQAAPAPAPAPASAPAAGTNPPAKPPAPAPAAQKPPTPPQKPAAPAPAAQKPPTPPQKPAAPAPTIEQQVRKYGPAFVSMLSSILPNIISSLPQTQANLAGLGRINYGVRSRVNTPAESEVVRGTI